MIEYYQNGMFSVENELFYEDNKRLGYFEDEEKGEILQNNHEKTVDRLNELRELNIELKRNNKELRKAYDKLRHRHSLLHDECLDAECERDSLKKDVNSLENENEQLKSEIEKLSKFENNGEHIRLSINIETGELQRHIYATGQWFGDFDRVLCTNWITEKDYQKFIDRVIEIYNTEFKGDDGND